MSYRIIALFPSAEAKPITKRSTILAARTTCQELNRIKHTGEYENAFFRFVDATKPYCNRCGKQDLDNAKGCLQPSEFSPAVGDWVCNIKPETKICSYRFDSDTLFMSAYPRTDLSTETVDN